MFRVLSLFLAVAVATGVSGSARADDAAAFMGHFSGDWLGTGQLLFGAENGMKFHCELRGDPSRSGLEFGMSGGCWMGLLSAPVHARLRYSTETREFYGEFMDGADGEGLDVIGTRNGDGFSLKLARGSTQGRLAADAVNADQMKIVIFYSDRANSRELPVAAMGFTRKGAEALGLPDYVPDIMTGSLGQ